MLAGCLGSTTALLDLLSHDSSLADDLDRQPCGTRSQAQDGDKPPEPKPGEKLPTPPASILPGLPKLIAPPPGMSGPPTPMFTPDIRVGVRVNSICPSYTLTPMVEKDLFEDTLGNDEELIAAARANHPIGRFAQPPEIAAAAVWLLSDKASFVTGTAMPVDGGYTAP